MVELVETVVHQYTVVARTEEEAVDTAMNLLDDGEDGVIIETDVESTDAIASDDYAQEEDEEFE